MLLKPPDPDTVRDALAPIAPAFNLDGNGPRFMQDADAGDGKESTIDNLLIGMPEETKISDNTDWFVKRGTVKGLCPYCAGAALFTLQTNAPAGGRGHMTSLRGGGPLTSVILGPTLWQTVWGNIINREEWDDDETPVTADDVRRFPWMGAIRISDEGVQTTPGDAHPDQAFWGIPRRIFLDFEDARPGTCDLCGEENQQIITHLRTKPYGVKYAGWIHPLSPYYRKDKSAVELLPLHLQQDGITYQNWLGTVINDKTKGTQISRNVTLFSGRTPPGKVRQIYSGHGGRPRLWLFGYDMDNKKPRCYYQGTMPIITTGEDWAATFEDLAAGMVRAASEAANNVRWCVKVALFDNPSDVKGDLSVITARFYQATEEPFFQGLEKAAAALTDGGDTAAIRQQWHETLTTTGKRLFDEYSQIDHIDAIDAERAVRARRLLTSPFSRANKAIRGHLGLPDPTKRET